MDAILLVLVALPGKQKPQSLPAIAAARRLAGCAFPALPAPRALLSLTAMHPLS
jgi:hypothetical protein